MKLHICKILIALTFSSSSAWGECTKKICVVKIPTPSLTEICNIRAQADALLLELVFEDKKELSLKEYKALIKLADKLEAIVGKKAKC
tara:strand:+ start:1457 stop:1720 length:264 start_codon:yes stop_codon:yes gene_type:complete